MKPLGDSAFHGFSNLFDKQHLGSVAAQIGGFGNPPKDGSYPWATAMARRCDADGRPNPTGEAVQFQAINVAGHKSWALHADEDRPLGAEGPQRSIVQIFRWIEPLPKGSK